MLTPSELAQAMDAYITKGTFAAAATAVGRDPSVVRRALLRHGADRRADLTALRLTKVEESLFETLQRLTAAAKLLSDWAMVPGENGNVTVKVNVLKSALDATRTVAALHTQLSVAAERRRLSAARRKRVRVEVRTVERALRMPVLDVPVIPAAMQ